MLWVQVIIFFVFGTVIGSFLNVVIFRIDNLKTVLADRSHCQSCKHVLAWFDLVPIFSYLALRGRCRYCSKKISPQYPLVELFCGLMFALLSLKFGITVTLFYYLIIFSILAVAFVYDLKTQMVPELFIWVALFFSVIGGWYFGNFGFLNMLYGAIVGGGFLAILVLVSHEKWMGAGDIKIGMILGVLLGYPMAIIGLFLAFVLGAIVGLVYIKIKNKTWKESLPFAPFLIFASFVALIFGPAILGWYYGFFIW